MSITAIVENDTIKLPVHVPDGTSVEVLLPGERGAGTKWEATGAGLADYRQRVAEARQRFVVNCPWKTTGEAMRELRAGEQDWMAWVVDTSVVLDLVTEELRTEDCYSAWETVEEGVPLGRRLKTDFSPSLWTVPGSVEGKFI